MLNRPRKWPGLGIDQHYGHRKGGRDVMPEFGGCDIVPTELHHDDFALRGHFE